MNNKIMFKALREMSDNNIVSMTIEKVDKLVFEQMTVYNNMPTPNMTHTKYCVTTKDNNGDMVDTFLMLDNIEIYNPKTEQLGE